MCDTFSFCDTHAYPAYYKMQSWACHPKVDPFIRQVKLKRVTHASLFENEIHANIVDIFKGIRAENCHQCYSHGTGQWHQSIRALFHMHRQTAKETRVLKCLGNLRSFVEH